MHISDSVIRELQVFASSCLWNSLLWGSSEKKIQLLQGYLMHSTKEYSRRTVPLYITIDWSSYWHLLWFPLFWSAWWKLRKVLPGWDCVDLKNKRPWIKVGSTQTFCCLLVFYLKTKGRMVRVLVKLLHTMCHEKLACAGSCAESTQHWRRC